MLNSNNRATEETPLCLGRRRRQKEECKDLLKSIISFGASEGVMRESHCGGSLIENLFASSSVREEAIGKAMGGGGQDIG